MNVCYGTVLSVILTRRWGSPPHSWQLQSIGLASMSTKCNLYILQCTSLMEILSPSQSACIYCIVYSWLEGTYTGRGGLPLAPWMTIRYLISPVQLLLVLTVEGGGVVSDFLALVTLRSSCVVSLPDTEGRVAGVFGTLRCVDALRIRVGWQGSVSSSGCVDDEGRVTHMDLNWTTSWVVEVFDRRDQGIVNCHIDGQFGIS